MRAAPVQAVAELVGVSQLMVLALTLQQLALGPLSTIMATVCVIWDLGSEGGSCAQDSLFPNSVKRAEPAINTRFLSSLKFNIDPIKNPFSADWGGFLQSGFYIRYLLAWKQSIYQISHQQYQCQKKLIAVSLPVCDSDIRPQPLLSLTLKALLVKCVFPI